MGRNMSAGLLTEIKIKKDRTWIKEKEIKLKDQIDEILKDISKFIDVTKYDINEENEEYCLKLKLDFIKENICDLLKEMKEIDPRINFINMIFDKRIDCLDEKLKKEHPIKCYINNNDEYVIESANEYTRSDMIFYPLYWILSDKRISQEIIIRGTMMPIWIDFNKVDGEDETFTLRIMNIMKTKCFNSKLSKCLIFEIVG